MYASMNFGFARLAGFLWNLQQLYNFCWLPFTKASRSRLDVAKNHTYNSRNTQILANSGFGNRLITETQKEQNDNIVERNANVNFFLSATVNT